jgi:magnesium transporter
MPIVMATAPAAANPDDPRASREAAPGSDTPAGPETLRGHIWTPAGMQVVDTVDEVTGCLANEEARVWIDVESATEETLARLAAILGLHKLVAKDIVEPRQRAKITTWDRGIHIVLFALSRDAELEVSEIDFILGERFLLTSHPSTWRPLDSLAADHHDVDEILAMGIDILLYAMVDPMVDAYFPVIDHLSDDIDLLEDDVVDGAQASIIARLFDVRRELLEVRHLVSPERDIFFQLSNRDTPFIAEGHRLYFRDIYDHTLRVTDELDTHRELTGAVLDAYLTSVNNNLSEVMKRLTAITAVLAGVGAAAGIFGMSEASTSLGLPHAVGFWLVAGVVMAIGVMVFVYFRRIDWI